MLKSFLPEISPYHISPLLLAYIGDAVYELIVRQYLVGRGPDKVQNIHQEAVNYVKADSQAKVLHALESNLSASECEFVKKGRNAKSGHMPKSTNVADYRYSTGFESLIGYLYLSGQEKRLSEIMDIVFRVIEEEQA